MTDAFRCDGCGEYWDDEFRFVSWEFDTDTLGYVDFTLDDLPTEMYDLVHAHTDGTGGEGDFCPECGRDVIEGLVELFDENDDSDGPEPITDPLLVDEGRTWHDEYEQPKPANEVADEIQELLDNPLAAIDGQPDPILTMDWDDYTETDVERPLFSWRQRRD